MSVQRKPIAEPRRAPEVFDRYLAELQGVPLLSAPEEVELARQIERGVIAHWSELLAYEPARPVVAAAIAASPEVSEALAVLVRARKPKPADIARVARKLRGLDQDCEALLAGDLAVREAFAETARAQRYLARVASAREAQLRAKSAFVAANLRLVIALARRYDNNSLLPLPDLIQEGNLGLMRAVERFDHRRGFRFSTYAAWWIRHALNRALSNQGRMVRLPVHALDDVARIKRALAAREQVSGVEPSDQELAAELGMSTEKLTALRVHARTALPTSLDKNLGEDSGHTLHDVLPATEPTVPDQEIDLERWRDGLDALLSGLTAIEATTLRLRFGLGGADELSLHEIGLKYNLSRERIRQIQKEALGKLRDALMRKRRAHDEDLAA